MARMESPMPARERWEFVRKVFPRALFAGKEWRLSTTAFALPRRMVADLRRLGPVLFRFQRASDLVYRRSARGSLPSWIAGYLDRGKPGTLIRYGLRSSLAGVVPAVIRPDLILEEDGLGLTEIDSVPGGIGLTACLNQTFAAMGDPVLGGGEGMVEGMRSIAPGGADLVISQESGDYRPEMEWLSQRLGEGRWPVHAAETYTPREKRRVYRFFELFDLGQIPFAEGELRQKGPGLDITPPMKAFLEEKLWAALFWSRPLREVWRREMRASHWEFLSRFVPYSWVVDPAPVPHHAVLPRLEATSFAEVANLSQKERRLVLKISGFSEKAWGSRGVWIGNDLSQPEWAGAVREALESFEHHPHVLQELRQGCLVEHPYWTGNGEEVIMRGRVRLCPYYFVPDGGGEVALGGVLATICPEDKKKLHGMRDAVMVPCVEKAES